MPTSFPTFANPITTSLALGRLGGAEVAGGDLVEELDSGVQEEGGLHSLVSDVH